MKLYIITSATDLDARYLHPGQSQPPFFFTVALRSQRPYGLLVTGGAQDVHLDFHTAPNVSG